MKKIISAVLVLVTLMSFVPVYAAKGDSYSDYEQQSEALKALGIVCFEFNEGNYGDLISKADFVQSAVRFMRDDISRYVADKPVFADVPVDNTYFADIECAAASGLLDKTENFYPEKYIDYDEAQKILVRLTGYEELTENGNYTGKAGQLKINSGVTPKDGVRKCDAVRMLYNCLDVDIPEKEEISANDYRFVYTRKAIEAYRGIKRSTGIVRQTYLCAVDGGGISNVGENDVVINDEVYTCNYGKTYDFLGCNTEFYYDKDTDTILYIREYKNECIEVNSEDFESFSGGRFYYYSGTRKSALRISESVDVIYNMDYYPDYTADDILLKGLTGKDTFIDNNNDGIYEIIKIDEYKDYALSSIDAEHKILYTKSPEKIIKLDGCRSLTFIDADKGETDISVLTAEHIVSVQRSKAERESDAIYRIYSSAKTKSGTATFVGTNKDFVKIDGEKYRVNANNASSIYSGQAGLIYFDYFGCVAYADYSISHSGYEYGFLISVWKNGDDTVAAKLLDSSGKVAEYSFCDRVRLDGKSKKPSDVYANLAERGHTKRQLIKFELNKDGSILKIDTKEHGENEQKETELKVEHYIDSHWFRSTSGTNSLNDEYCFTKDAVMFLVPNISDNVNADIKNYRVTTPQKYRIPSNTYVTMDVADPDDCGISEVGVYYYPYSETVNIGGNDAYSTFNQTNSYMVDSVTQELNDDDEIKTYLYYFEDGLTLRAEVLDPNVTKKYAYKTSLGEGETDWVMRNSDGTRVTKDLAKGDIIQFRTDDRGIITSVYLNNDSERVDNGRFSANSIGEFGMIYAKSGNGIETVVKLREEAPLYNPSEPEKTFEITEAPRPETWKPYDFSNQQDKTELDKITVRSWLCDKLPVVYNKERNTIRLGNYSDIVDYKTAKANPSLAYLRVYHVTNRCLFIYE